MRLHARQRAATSAARAAFTGPSDVGARARGGRRFIASWRRSKDDFNQCVLSAIASSTKDNFDIVLASFKEVQQAADA